MALASLARFCDEDLLSVDRMMIESWLDSCRLTASSRADYLSYVHCFFAWAIREELTDVDPTVRIPTPRKPKRLPRPVSEEWLEKAFANADPRMLAMLALAACAGLRCMEIAGLDVEDFLWGSPVTILVRGKGGKDRVLPIARKVEATLRTYGIPTRGPLFPKRDGTHYSPSSVSSMINVFLHNCGVPFTAHQFRHRFGSRFYAKSKDPLLTQEMMGHESFSTTRGYIALCPEPAARVVEEL